MHVKNQATNCCLQLIKKSESNNDNLSLILIEAIEESFSSLINSEYDIFYLLNANGITKENIQNNIKKFANIIENQFGLGAKLIEIKIAELIHKKIQNFSYTPKNKNLFFEEYLNTLFSK